MTAVGLSSDSTLCYITVSSIRCFNLPDDAARYWVVLSIPGVELKTALSERTRNPIWSEEFSHAVHRPSSISLTVWKHHRLRRNDCVGSVHINIDHRLEGDVDQDIPLDLALRRSSETGLRPSPRATIRCKITEKSKAQINKQVVSDAEADVSRLREAPVAVRAVLGVSGATSKIIEEDVIAWEPVIEGIRAFAGLVKDISNIHPYAHAAMTVFSVMPTLINNQLKTDEQLKKLVHTMKRAYEFVNNASALEHIKLHAEFFEKMARATLECGNFIKEYVNSDSFAARAIKGMISDKARTQMENHILALCSHMDQFKEDGAVLTEISVLRTLDVTESIAAVVDEQAAKSYLDDMRYAADAGCVPEKRCLGGTRLRLLRSIIDQLHGVVAEGEQPKRIVLLTGVAGSGKSAVAHEIAHYFRSLHRLGGSFCFNASRQTELSLDRFLSTISRGLADLDSGWRNALVEVIKPAKDIRTTRSPKQQYEDFILKPAQKLEFVGPIVVVIDAIDEVAENDRDSLIECLVRLAEDEKLPANIRFLITSRTEPRMVDELTQLPHVVIQSISDETFAFEIGSDIGLFVEHALTAKFPEPKRAAIRENWAPFIVARAENLFQWAATACAFITQKSAGSTPEKRFLTLKQGGHSTLYGLYETIIGEIVETTTKGDPSVSKADIIAKIRRVLALILTAREPLTWRAWTALLLDDNALQDFLEVVPFLGSLLRGASELASAPIQPLHTSFRDYTTLPVGSHSYTVDTLAAETTLATLSFVVMKNGLNFNICGLETSYRANKDVPDLAGRMQRSISPALTYVCQFWTSHLTATPHKQYLIEALFSFLEQRLLFWIEVMSLLRMTGSASAGIKEALKWIETHTLEFEADRQLNELKDMLGEVDQFLLMCIPAISLSTPHLYLSALAYVPQASFIHRCYSEVYTGGVHIVNKEDVRWSECILRIVSSNHIRSVAVSPDGRTLATGDGEGTVVLWDAVTGERMGDPLEGHTDQVWSVTFSPNGKTLGSGSGDGSVRLWNVATGTQLGDALQSRTSTIWSVAFSLDGETLLSGSDDGTVLAWSVSSGELTGEALTGLTSSTRAAAFSPHGKTVALGLVDGTVGVLNTETRKLMYAPLTGHAGQILAVAFSPDGRILASGAYDKIIRLWDAATGQPTGSLRNGHTDWVSCIAFSPDGRILASGSLDQTIRLWTVDTGKPVGGPLVGHSSWIRSLAFLPDSQRIASVSDDKTTRVWKTEARQVESAFMAAHSGVVSAVAFSPSNDIAASGSADCTVRLWNVHTGMPVGEPLRGHTNSVKSVAFSPDGGTIVSGSDDCTIRLWNAQTGQPAREPIVGDFGWVFTVVFSPDGTIFASGSYDMAIRLWSALTGEQLGAPLTGHTNSVTSVVFSPDGRYLVSWSWDGTIMLWNVTTRKRIGEPLRHGEYVFSVAFSPDGQIIASGGDNTIRLWRVDTQEPIAEFLEAHADRVNSIAFSPFGKTLISGSADCTICLWDVATRKPIGGPLRGHTADVNSVAFSPDGTTILSGSDDRTVRLWGLPAVHSTRSAYHEAALPLPEQSENSVTTDNTHSNMTASSINASLNSTVHDIESSSGSSATIEHSLNSDSSILDNVTGYMLGPEDELLFWVSPDYQTGLWRPATRWIAGTRSLRLDLSRFVHGERWEQCQGP